MEEGDAWNAEVEDAASPTLLPARQKVPLPSASFRDQITDALQPLLALLRIPRDPLKHYRGKSTASRLYLVASYFLPCIDWLRHYKRAYLLGDLLSGVAVWSLVPQDLGYATLANLPASYGLYSNLLPPLAYAVLGTSRHLSVGPTAIVSLLISSLCSKVYDPFTQQSLYIAFVTTVTFFSGIFLAGLGLLRFGFLADVLSHASILGFLAGSAIISSLLEFRNILGYVTPPLGYNIVYLFQYFINYGSEFNWRAFLIGCSFYAFLVILKILSKRLQHRRILGRTFLVLTILGPLLSIVIATLCVWATGADGPPTNVPTVAEIRGNGNEIADAENSIFETNVGRAIGVGILVGLMSIAEAIAIGRVFASAKGYSINVNKELFALGVANILSSLFAGFAVAGSFARSSLTFTSGTHTQNPAFMAHTQIVTVVMSLLVLATIFSLFHVFGSLPLAVLSAVVIDAVLALIRIPSALHIWRTDKLDFLVFVATFLSIIFFSIEIGFLVAASASLLKLVVPIARPPLTVLGEVSGTGMYRSIQQYEWAVQPEHVIVLRIDGPLIFANAGYIRESFMKIVTARRLEAAVLTHVVLDLTAVSDVDTTGIHAMFELLRSFEPIQFVVSNPSRMVLRKMVASGFLDILGTDKLFFSIHEAVTMCSRFSHVDETSLSRETNGSGLSNRTTSIDDREWQY